MGMVDRGIRRFGLFAMAMVLSGPNPKKWLSRITPMLGITPVSR